MSYYIHQTPGRLRVRTPVVKDDAAMAGAVRGLLSRIEGVTFVRCSVGTGSVTVTYDVYRLSASTLINVLARHGYLVGVIGFPRPLPVRRGGRRRQSDATAQPLALSPQARRWLGLAARVFLPVLAERAFGRPARILVAGLL